MLETPNKREVGAYVETKTATLRDDMTALRMELGKQIRENDEKVDVFHDAYLATLDACRAAIFSMDARLTQIENAWYRRLGRWFLSLFVLKPDVHDTALYTEEEPSDEIVDEPERLDTSIAEAAAPIEEVSPEAAERIRSAQQAFDLIDSMKELSPAGEIVKPELIVVP